MRKILIIVIASIALYACDENEESNPESYIRFNANGEEVLLEYVKYNYITIGSASTQNMTNIYGYKAVTYGVNDNGQIAMETQLPFFNIMIPFNNTGSWTQNDTIIYSIEMNMGAAFNKPKHETPANSSFNFEITEHGSTGENCIGNFSGVLINENNDTLIIKDGSFMVEITE